MKRLIDAFGNSIASLRHNFTNETAVRQEMILIALGFPVALFIAGDAAMFIALWGSLLLLLSVELLNTGLERLSDRVTTEIDPMIKIVKDAGSAAVLLITIIVVMIWALGFYRFFFG